MKRFRLYPNGEYVGLNLVYPKPEKSELRLYIAKRRGFMPAKGQVWFLFVDKHDNLWIGAMDEVQWRRFNSFDVNEECSGGEINGRPDESKLAQEETRANISSLYTPPAEILTPTVHETATILAEDKNATEDKIRRRCLLRRRWCNILSVNFFWVRFAPQGGNRPERKTTPPEWGGAVSRRFL